MFGHLAKSHETFQLDSIGSNAACTTPSIESLTRYGVVGTVLLPKTGTKTITPSVTTTSTAGAAPVKSHFVEDQYRQCPSLRVLEGLDMTHCVVAGGMISNLVFGQSSSSSPSPSPSTVLEKKLSHGEKPSDIDIFPITNDKAQALDQLKKIHAHIVGKWGANHTRIFQNSQCVTFFNKQTGAEIQYVLRMCQSVSELLNSFDMGSCMFAWNNSGTIVTNELGRFTYTTRLNLVSLVEYRKCYEARLAKYFDRGFGIYIHGKIPNYKKDNYELRLGKITFDLSTAESIEKTESLVVMRTDCPQRAPLPTQPMAQTIEPALYCEGKDTVDKIQTLIAQLASGDQQFMGPTCQNAFSSSAAASSSQLEYYAKGISYSFEAKELQYQNLIMLLKGRQCENLLLSWSDASDFKDYGFRSLRWDLINPKFVSEICLQDHSKHYIQDVISNQRLLKFGFIKEAEILHLACPDSVFFESSDWLN